MRITLASGCPAELARPDGDDVGGFDDRAASIAREHDLVVCAPGIFPGRDLGADIGAHRAAAWRRGSKFSKVPSRA